MADGTTNNTTEETTDWSSLTVAELLKQPLSERKGSTAFDEKDIAKFTLDEVPFKGYKAYSFFYEMTLLKQPERTQSGVIDLSTHAYFLTPHLKIDYSLMPYPMFCELRKMMTQKLTFNLTCFDTDNHTVVEDIEVYFAPDSFPKFATMARRLLEEEVEIDDKGNIKTDVDGKPITKNVVNKYIEILGVRDYTIELIGTNRTVATNKITYKVNPPKDGIWNGDTEVTKQYPKNATVKVGARAFVASTAGDENTLKKISTLTFENPDDENSNKWEFVKWTSDNSDYIDGNEYFVTGDKEYTAQWTQVREKK